MENQPGHREILAGAEGKTSDDRLVKVMTGFSVTVTPTHDNRYECAGTHGLLLRAIGDTPKDAMSQYITIAADQVVENVEADRRGDEIGQYARFLHENLTGVFQITDL